MESIVMALSFLFVATVSGINTPKPCCTAQQFEVSYGGTVGMVQDSTPSALREFFNGAFDFTNRQYGMEIYVDIYGSAKVQYQVIQLFNKGEEYIIQGGVCQRIAPVDEPQRCVSDKAQYRTSFYLGNQALLVDDWYQLVNTPQVVGDVYATTSREDCTPGQVSFVGTQTSPTSEKVQLMSSGTYMNFTEGISDPDRWFVPPASCNNATSLTKEGSGQHIQHWKRMRAMQLLL